ncbi:hypothetical protein ASG11_05305 [Sphingomonas sp. Leaf357]|uniref:AMP-binding protein n=1 Tax=Sphingomonas sp. Leaf357 TaxID=1736350 RepID=UPI0006FAEEAF|nr:AMP-binding protein [Sphingomonas sp. Leaf357]KQS03731.1 hypothetical protein ASG11_05305 [Sphingomonas sp. Leaf357]
MSGEGAVVVNYVSAIRAAAEKNLDASASIFDGGERSWRETLDRAARIAGGLLALGLEPGDRVAILSANSAEYMVLYLAVPWAGGVLAPLNYRWSVAENAFALDDCSPRVLFLSDDFAAANVDMLAERADRLTVVALGKGRPEWTPLDALLASAPAEQVPRDGNDILTIYYTGGTTGRSKGVMISHAGLVGNCQAMRDEGLCPDGTRMLIVAPLFHLAAGAALSMTMLAGGTAVIAAAFDPVGTLDLIAEERVIDALLVPTMIQLLIDAPGFAAGKLTSLQRILYGASQMPEAVIDRIIAAAPHVDFYQAYGMTETSCTATLLRPEHHRGEHRAAGRHRGAGLPLGTTEIAISNDEGAHMPTGAVGEIIVRGPGVMLGYWNQPAMTAAAVRDGWMHTGDGGRIDDSGVLYVVDRIKDMIVSGGENIYSAEVESAIGLHPAVAQVAVIGVPDARWGERVHAVIVLRSGDMVGDDMIVAHCRTLIAGYKVPRSIEFRDALPLSAAGKVLKADLRAPHWQGRTRNVA